MYPTPSNVKSLFENTTGKSIFKIFKMLTKTLQKNPAYGRHQISRLMRIVGPIQFWRVCVIYLEKKEKKVGRLTRPRIHASKQRLHARAMDALHPTPVLGIHMCNKMGSAPVLPRKIRQNQHKKKVFLHGDFRPLANKNVQF